jgi:hypothetical protein
MSGVLADCACLLRNVQDENAAHLRRHGPASPLWEEPRLAAAVVANSCQRRAFGGGLRPFGSAFVVCGLAWREGPPNEGKDPFEALEAWQTDPSGALQYLDPENGPVHVVGAGLGPGSSGAASSSTSLLERLSKLREATPRVTLTYSSGGASSLKMSDSSPRDSSVPLGQVIRSIHNVLLEEWNRSDPPSSSVVTNNSSIRSSSGSIRGEIQEYPAISFSNSPPTQDNRDDSAAPDKEEESLEMEVEVAVISPETGAYKLAPEQVHRLLFQGS